MIITNFKIEEVGFNEVELPPIVNLNKTVFDNTDINSFHLFMHRLSNGLFGFQVKQSKKMKHRNLKELAQKKP
jgi:hypothetical protein